MLGHEIAIVNGGVCVGLVLGVSVAVNVWLDTLFLPMSSVFVRAKLYFPSNWVNLSGLARVGSGTAWVDLVPGLGRIVVGLGNRLRYGCSSSLLIIFVEGVC